MEIVTAKRNRRKQVKSTSVRLLEAAKEARSQAARLPPGRERHQLLRRAREAETTAHLNDWLTSPGLSPPT
jgi:hypothetical protein